MFGKFFSIFKTVKSPASGKENVRFPDSPDFEIFPDFQTGRDVRQSPNLTHNQTTRWKIIYICHITCIKCTLALLCKNAHYFSLFFIEDFYDGMEEMRESYGDNIAFLYVSDDMKWGRANIKDKENDLYFVGMGSISNNVEVTTTG